MSSNKFERPPGGWTRKNFPFMDPGMIADETGLSESTIRRHITERNPRLVPDLHDEDGTPMYWFLRETVALWFAAYNAAPKLGRRGDGSKQRKKKESGSD